MSTKTRRIPLVLTYHPGLPDINAITRRLLPVLHVNPAMKQSCPDPPLISFRRPRNLGNMVIRAKLRPDTAPNPIHCGPCSEKGPKRGRRCELCSLLPSQTSVISSSTRQTHQLKLRTQADCDSTFVVYLISCTLCNTNNQYVGETTNFRKRMNNHKSCVRHSKIKDDDCTLLYQHFSQPNHSISNMKFTILQQCNNKADLLKSESLWFHTLKTLTPLGLNISDKYLS